MALAHIVLVSNGRPFIELVGSDQLALELILFSYSSISPFVFKAHSHAALRPKYYLHRSINKRDSIREDL